MIQAPKGCQLCQDAAAPCTEIPHYKLMVCIKCTTKNRGGWQREHEPLLRQGLQRSGLFIPDRTPEGLLPFTYQPPSDYAI